MPSPERPLLETIAKFPLFDWMRPKPRREVAPGDGHHCGSSDFGSSSSNNNAAVSTCSPRKLRTPRLSAEESTLLSRTAPISTCTSNISAVSWSEQTTVVGSSDSSTGASGMAAFPRLGHKSSPELKLDIVAGDAPAAVLETRLTVAPAPTPAPPMDIPWRLLDPDSATTPMQEALNHSLGQMELRMSGRHTTKNSTACRRKDYSQFHRRTQSALPVSRADAPTVDIRPTIPLGGGGRVENDDDDAGGAPSSFWKLTPPAPRPSGGSGAVAHAAVKSRPRFDFPNSPRESRPAGRGHFGFEGYFAAESTAAAESAAAAAAAAAAADAKAAESLRPSYKRPEDDLCVEGGVPVEDGFDDPDSTCMFEFDDM
ncbi:unnamed protein product [Ectocarpus sp. CCAP 1310/34]|nr:unnamed protein product [Ectocarpus sp. CCAP 1310/34]